MMVTKMKIINLKTGMENEIPMYSCKICDCTFEEGEGGLHNGLIGMIAVSFCPTCFSGLLSMSDYFRGEEIE